MHAALACAVLLFGMVGSAEAGVNVWTRHSPPGPLQSVSVVPGTPSTLYACITFDYSVLFRSTDGGATWDDIRGYLPALGVVAADPSQPMTVYAGAHHYHAPGEPRMFKSIEGGVTWRAASTGLESMDVVHVATIAIDPLTPSTVYAGTTQGVFRSIDGGATWNPANAGLPIFVALALAIDPIMPSTIYAGGAEAYLLRLFKSTDGGDTWDSADTGLPSDQAIRGLVIDTFTRSTIYAATRAGVFKSTDAGSTWN
jgi:photosystem II stability/assembly factor-like uncharacterized protein